MILRLLCLLLFISSSFAYGQEAKDIDEVDPVEQIVPAVPQDVRALNDLLSTITAQEEELAEARRLLKTPELTEEEISDLNTTIDTIKERKAETQLQFEVIATGLREEDIVEQTEEALSFEQELRQLLSPLMNEIREATENPREIDRLRGEISELETRQGLANGAIKNLKKLQAATDEENEKLRAELAEEIDSWTEILTATRNRLSATQLQLDKRLALKEDLVTSLSNYFREFFRSRFWNILVAALSFAGVFFLLKKAFPLFKKLSPVHRKNKRNFASRAADIAYGAFTITAATIAALVALYVAGDWVLLSVAALILIGLAWGARQAIPPMMEQIRLILNIGPVREDERIIYEGIPWKVQKLAFYSKLVNPELAGGIVRLPARTLLEFHSRPFDKDEIWFPTRKQDWVFLADDSYGKVLLQTPEYVQIMQLGGARKTYPTSDFLGLAPQNLSQGFRVKGVFGIDYSHQEISTTQVAPLFERALEDKLLERFGKDAFQSVQVSFASANASSLDYEVLADFKGAGASSFQKIRRAIQLICVDVCNEQGWGIPFQQITLHRA